jgi:hypothetical protein
MPPAGSSVSSFPDGRVIKAKNKNEMDLFFRLELEFHLVLDL